MALPKDEIIAGLDAELQDFEELLRSLNPDDLTRTSRCEGWTIGDVAAHVAGGLADALSGNLDGAGTPEYTQRQVDERRGRSAAELADEVAMIRKGASEVLGAFDEAGWNSRVPVGYDGTIGEGVEALWYDAYLHADDIRASVSHVAFELEKRGYGPATLALEGMPEFTVQGGGRRIEGDPLAFVLAATGRIDPAPLGLDASVNIYAG
jgi:uncharacterized protein (TIGR03083 family)